MADAQQSRASSTFLFYLIHLVPGLHQFPSRPVLLCSDTRAVAPLTLHFFCCGQSFRTRTRQGSSVNRQSIGIRDRLDNETEMAPSRPRLRGSEPPTQPTSAADTPMTDDMEVNGNICDAVNKDGDDEDSSIAVCCLAFSANPGMHVLGFRTLSQRSFVWSPPYLLNGSDVFS